MFSGPSIPRLIVTFSLTTQGVFQITRLVELFCLDSVSRLYSVTRLICYKHTSQLLRQPFLQQCCHLNLCIILKELVPTLHVLSCPQLQSKAKNRPIVRNLFVLLAVALNQLSYLSRFVRQTRAILTEVVLSFGFGFNGQ